MASPQGWFRRWLADLPKRLAVALLAAKAKALLFGQSGLITLLAIGALTAIRNLPLGERLLFVVPIWMVVMGFGVWAFLVISERIRHSRLPVRVQANVMPFADHSAPPHDMFFVKLNNVDLTNFSTTKSLSLEIRLAWGRASGPQIGPAGSPRFDLKPQEHQRIPELKFYCGTIDSDGHREHLFRGRPFLFVEDHMSRNIKTLTEGEFVRGQLRPGP